MFLQIPIKPLVLVGSPLSGRSAIIFHLIRKMPHKFERLISTTSRVPRSNEQNNVSFYFKTEKEILDNESDFITLTKSPNNHYYGLSFDEIQRVYNLRKIPIFKMTLEAYKKNVGSMHIPSESEKLPNKKTTLYLLRDKSVECNALYLNVANLEDLQKRLQYSPINKSQIHQKVEQARREQIEAEKYFGDEDIIDNEKIDQIEIAVKSRLFELY